MLAMLVILPTIAFGQFTIKGKLTDRKTHEMLANGKIYIEGTSKVSISGSKGDFEFGNLKTGAYILKVTYMGYKTAERYVTVVGNDIEINIEMEQSPVLGEEVIVSSTKADDKTPVTFENISKKEIQEHNLGPDIPVLIENTPSVTVATDAGTGTGYTYLRIRGTDATRINVTVNGIPFNDPESHEVYWVDLPDFASSLENMQIQRGVGSSTNGAAAFGASINLQTTPLKAEPFAEYNASFGSYNTMKNTISFGTGLIDNKFEFDGRLSKISSDGYIDRATSELKSFFLSGGYFGKKSFVKFNIFFGVEKTYQAWDGVPKDSLKTNRTYNPFTYSNQIDNYQQDHYELFYSNALCENLNLTLALFDIRGKGYYENYQDMNDPYAYASAQTSFASYGLNNVVLKDTTITNSNNINQKWLENNFYGSNLSLTYDNRRKLKLTFGASWNKYEGKHFGKVIWSQYASNGSIDRSWYDNTGNREEANVFGKMSWQMTEKLNYYLDLQDRNIFYKIVGIHDNLLDISQTHKFNFVNPKTGLLYNFDYKSNVYFSFALANREPNRSNYEDARPGEMPQPERLYDYELGYSYKTTNFVASVNYYEMTYKDQLVLTGKINDVGAPVMTNVSNSYRQGLEFVFDANLIKKLKWDANLTLSKNKILDFTEYVDVYDANWNFIGQKENFLGTTDISFSPAVIGSNRFTYELTKGLNVSLISKYTGKQFVDNTSNNDRSLDAYFVNNLLMSYSFKTKYIKEIGLSLLVNNIFSEKYSSNAWVYDYYLDGAKSEMNGYFPQAPVNFMAGISLKF